MAAVTGSTRGIGRAIAEAFMAQGASMVINSRSREAAERAAAELGDQARGVVADVGTPEGAQAVVDAALHHFGRLDVMVCNAGINVVKDTVELTPEEWRSVLTTNLDGVFFSAQRAGRAMLAQGSGCVIAIASVTSFNAFPRRAPYATSKAGVAMLVKVLAAEWAAHGVRVNAIAPGYVRTDLVEGLEREGKLDFATIERRTPMGRLAEPEEIARVAVFLASDDASYVTGETLAVDGGWIAYGFT